MFLLPFVTITMSKSAAAAIAAAVTAAATAAAIREIKRK